jgi:hypothetical protein
MEKLITKLYRFEAGWQSKPWISEFDIIKETPCGYWIKDWRYGNPHEINGKLTRWIPKNTIKRYAYSTKEGALLNYIRRTEKYIEHLNKKLDDAKIRLKLAKKTDLSVKLITFDGGF